MKPFSASEVGKKYAAANPPDKFPKMDRTRLAAGYILSKDEKQIIANPGYTRKSEQGKQSSNTISVDETNEHECIHTQLYAGNESISVKETLLDTGTKLNFISSKLFTTKIYENSYRNKFNG